MTPTREPDVLEPAEIERLWAERGSRSAGDKAFKPGVITGAMVPRLVELLLYFWRPALRGKPHRGALYVAGERITRQHLSRFFCFVGFPARSGQVWQKALQLFGAAFASTMPSPHRAARITACLREVLVGEGEAARATLGGMWRRALGYGEEPPQPWAACLKRPELSPDVLKEKWLAHLRDDLWCIGWPDGPRVPPRLQRRAAWPTIAAAPPVALPSATPSPARAERAPVGLSPAQARAP